MNPTTALSPTEQLVTTLTQQMATLTRTLGDWMQEQPHTLAELEQHVLRLLKELGSTLLAGACSLAAPAASAPTLPCPCGQTASFQRQRTAQVTTLLGPIQIARSYYLCAACGQGQHPLDTQLHICAGSRSQALDELLALLGATQGSFVQAAEVLERLSLVHVSANSVRDATEHLGTVLLAQHPQPLDQHPEPSRTQPNTPAKARRLYITMDGVLAHLRQRGWSELKVGCCYHTRSRPAHLPGEREQIRAHSASYLTSLDQAQEFGWRLWHEAVRRGYLDTEEVVILGDGAHWIWHNAEKHFPRATQIVDWYHASSYVWNAASAIWGEGGTERAIWARTHLDKLWEGKVSDVLLELERWGERGEAVEAALSYYRTHQGRMDYARYRAEGMQIGSGSAESGCKQLVSARLKGAGMIWSERGAEAVAAVRAWLKSERWEEAVALRGVKRRGYRRKQARQARGGTEKNCSEAREQTREEVAVDEGVQQSVLSAEVLARVQAELEEQRGKNAWGKAWSIKRQAEVAMQRAQSKPASTA